MGKRDELIAKYADDLKNKCGMTPDMALLTKVTIGCGPSIYNADGPSLMAAINSVIETYGKSERNKYRAVFYYMLVKHFGKESVYK